VQPECEHLQRALHVAQWKHWHSSQVTLTPLRLTV
jgi:hypothetical protein